MEKMTNKQTATVGLRLVLAFGIVASVMALLLFVRPETASAAKEITLNPGVRLVVTPDSCTLSVPVAKPLRVKVSCAGYTPTPTETVTATSTPTSASYAGEGSDNASAESELAPQMKRTLGANKSLNILPNGCQLAVNKNTMSKVVVYCVPNPTPTMTPSRTPTVAKPTAVPPQSGIWIGVTSYNMPVSFEVSSDGKRISQFSLRTYGRINYGLWCRPWIYSSGNVTINNNRFEIKSSSGASSTSAVGNFESTTSISGSYTFSSPSTSVCGEFFEQGTWTATK